MQTATPENRSNIVYTVGYTAFPTIVEMSGVWSMFGIDVLIDVRSVPFSKIHTSFNKPVLREACRHAGIIYRHYYREFGARQTDPQFLTDGQVDFEKFAASGIFQDGINKVKSALEMGYTPCLLCSEKDPINCHRSILIGRALQEVGIDILHIMADYTVQTQKDIEDRLKEQYLAPMWETMCSEEEIRQEIYRVQGKKIGYRIPNAAEKVSNL